MGATEEAGVKIKVAVDDKSLKDFGKAIGTETAKGAHAAEKELDKLTKSAADARSKMGSEFAKVGKSIGSTLASGIKTASAVGAAGAVAIIKGNMDAEKSFRKVAFAARAGGAQGLEWNKIQSKAMELSKRWGTSQEELAQGMAKAFEKSGDANYALKSMDSLAVAGTASGQNMEALGTIAGELNAKFGVTGDKLDEAMARILELGNKGGMSVEEIAGSFDAMGKSASRAGIQGVEGFTQMIALSTKMGDAVGGETAALSQLSKVLVKLGPAADAKQKAALKAAGIDTSRSSIEILEQLMHKTGGDAGKLSKFVGAQGATFLETGLGKTGFDEAMAEAGKSSLKYSDVLKEAEKNAESNEARIKRAMATIAERLAQPDVMNAIERLTKSLPQLADAVVAIVDKISEHPKLTAAALIASQSGGALGALGGLAGSVGKWALASRAAPAAAAGAEGAAPAAPAAAAGGASIAMVGAAAVALAAATYFVHKDVKEQLRDGTDPVKSNALQGAAKTAAILAKAVKEGDAEKVRDMAESEKHFAGSTGATDTSVWGKMINAKVDAKYASIIDTAERVGNIRSSNRQEQGGYHPVDTYVEKQDYTAEVDKANAALRKKGGVNAFQWDNQPWAAPGTKGSKPPAEQNKPNEAAKALADLPSRLATTKLQVTVLNYADFAKSAPGDGGGPDSIFKPHP